MATEQPTGASTVDVLIVGGGLAGLTAALALREQGLSLLVLERDTMLGGRAASWADPTTGDPVHIGPHILLSEYPNFLALLDLCGTRDQVAWQTGRFIRMVDGQREIDMTMADLPAPLHYAPSLLRDETVGHLDRLSNLPVSLLAARLSEEDVLRLDNVNAAAFLRSMGVTEWFLRRFWQFASMSIMNVPLELCSAGALLRFYRRLIGHRRYDVGFPRCGLGDLFGPPAQAMLEACGHRVELGAHVTGFTGDAQRVTGVELADGRRIEARVVVAALPPRALRRIARREWMDRAPFRDLVHFQACPYVSTYLWFDRKLTREQFWARSFDPNDLNCDFYDYSNIYPGPADRPSLIASNCIFCERASELSDAEIVAETVRELAEYLPEAASAKLVHSAVHRIPMAIHCPVPGTEQLRPDPKAPIDHLVLAGDWMKTGLPSSMESACASGFRAAELVLQALGAPVPALVHPPKPVEGLVRLTQVLTRGAGLARLPSWVKATGPLRPPKGMRGAGAARADA